MKTPAATEVTTSVLNSANSTGLELVSIKAEPRVDSRLLAQQLGNQHKAVIALIERYSERIRGFGQLPFKKEVGGRAQGGGKAERFALLNENQTFFVLSLSRNTERVVALKDGLVRAFDHARRAADIRHADYLPAYHALHDAIKEKAVGSTNAHWMHANANKALNKLAGLQPGQRGRAGPGALSVLNVGALLATQAIKEGDGRRMHDRIKAALVPLQGVQELLVSGDGVYRASTMDGSRP